MSHLSMHLPSRVSKFRSDLKSEELKSTYVSNRALPLGNLGTNPKELHTPKSTPKKLEGDGGDKKKKSELNRVFCKNEA
jgi:hypothetical protein